MSTHRPSSPAPPDPPIGTGATAFANLFKPETPTTPLSPGNAELLHKLTWAAVIIHGGQATGKFTTAAFARAVQEMFQLRQPPDAKWCRDVLRKVGHVTAYPTGDHYRTQTG